MLWWVPFAAGFEDGFNPCALTAGAVLLVLRLWIEGREMNPWKFLPVFAGVLYAVNLILNMGLWADALAADGLQKGAVFFYRILGAGFFVLGAVFFYDWILMLKGNDPRGLLSARLFRSKTAGRGNGRVYGAVIPAAIALGVMGTIWPLNRYIMIFSNNIFFPGKFWSTAGVMALHAAAQMWLVMAILFLFDSRRLTARLQKAIMAAVFLSVAGVWLKGFKL